MFIRPLLPGAALDIVSDFSTVRSEILRSGSRGASNRQPATRIKGGHRWSMKLQDLKGGRST